jgi:hypothetical protein
MKTIQTISSADFNYLEALILDRLCGENTRASPFEVLIQASSDRKPSKHNKRDKNEQKRNNPDRLESADKEQKTDTKKAKIPLKASGENTIGKELHRQLMCKHLFSQHP